MSTRIMALCWPLKLSATDKSVLISLADNANDAGHCWPSLETISERTCLGRSTIIRSIHSLESLGLVSANRTNGRHTTYIVTPVPVPQRDPSRSDTGVTVTRDPSRSDTGPVPQRDTNRHITVNEPSIREVPTVLVADKSPTRPDCPIAKIRDLYHEVLPELPVCERLTEKRMGYIRQRWREWAVEKKWLMAEEGLAEFRKFFLFVRRSPFLMGKVTATNGRPPFVADLEFLMRSEKFTNIVEGKYHAQA